MTLLFRLQTQLAAVVSLALANNFVVGLPGRVGSPGKPKPNSQATMTIDQTKTIKEDERSYSVCKATRLVPAFA